MEISQLENLTILHNTGAISTAQFLELIGRIPDATKNHLNGVYDKERIPECQETSNENLAISLAWDGYLNFAYSPDQESCQECSSG